MREEEEEEEEEVKGNGIVSQLASQLYLSARATRSRSLYSH